MQQNPILIALTRLDVTDAEHWTADGQPRVDVVSKLKGGDPLTRQEIIDIAPTFTQGTAPELIAAYLADEQVTPERARELRDAAVARAAAEAPPAAPAGKPPGIPQSNLPPAGTTLANLTEKPAEPEPFVLEEDQRAVDLPIAQVMQSRELMELALVEIDADSQALIKEKAEIQEEMRRLSAKAVLVSTRLSRWKKNHPVEATTEIQDYLKRSAKNREERARRTRKFVDAGVNPKDVADELRGASKIDVALGQRKPAPGSTRPAHGIPVQGRR
mgnify:CR=1 FL=1|tara:strand:- start:28899 stop:29717 length:819 start_codon:yes stop_codon:yes gene_type:complete